MESKGEMGGGETLRNYYQEILHTLDFSTHYLDQAHVRTLVGAVYRDLRHPFYPRLRRGEGRCSRAIELA